MNTQDRMTAYMLQNGSGRLTGPQERRVKKKAHKENDPTAGKRGRLRRRMDVKDGRRIRREAASVVAFIRARRNGQVRGRDAA